MLLFTTEGLHVPVIPLVDVVDNSGATPPLHIAGKVASNVGSIFGFTITVSVLLVVEVAPSESVIYREYIPEFAALTLFITGFSTDETKPFGPVQKKLYGATPSLGFAVRVKLSPSQIDVEEAVGFTVGSNNKILFVFINSEFELIWELGESIFRLAP